MIMENKAKCCFGVLQSGTSEFMLYRIRTKVCSFKAVHQTLSIRFVALMLTWFPFQ